MIAPSKERAMKLMKLLPALVTALATLIAAIATLLTAIRG
jgi:hypothetical protein